jgi:hypothetical protein
VPVHDWTLVQPGIFHDFYVAWLAEVRSTLNEGLLPAGFYALAEQHAGNTIADVLTLHVGPTPTPEPFDPLPEPAGGTLLTVALPRVRRRQTVQPMERRRRRTIAIRHVSRHQLIAMIEIVSPANKDRVEHLDDFSAKVASALASGVHVLVLDLFPPGTHDPAGIHGIIRHRLEESEIEYDLPPAEPLTLASYTAGPAVEAYLEHLAAGAALPDMPLFLSSTRYVNVPLASTYDAAFRGMPAYWRDVLEGR